MDIWFIHFFFFYSLFSFLFLSVSVRDVLQKSKLINRTNVRVNYRVFGTESELWWFSALEQDKIPMRHKRKMTKKQQKKKTVKNLKCNVGQSPPFIYFLKFMNKTRGKKNDAFRPLSDLVITISQCKIFFFFLLHVLI